MSTRTRTLLSLTAAAALTWLAAAPAHAQAVPAKIPIQGVLTDSSGNPLSK